MTDFQFLVILWITGLCVGATIALSHTVLSAIRR